MTELKHIGDFGVEHDDHVDLSFGYFGNEIRVHPDAGELTYLDFMAKAMAVSEEDETEGIKITMDFLRKQVHPEDWDTFWDTSLAKRQKLADLMLVSKAIVEETAGFPTTPSSDSPVTPPAIAPKSRAVSSRRGKQRAIESAKPIDSQSTSVKDLAMEQLTGRPDLMRAVELASSGVGVGR